MALFTHAPLVVLLLAAQTPPPAQGEPVAAPAAEQPAATPPPAAQTPPAVAPTPAVTPAPAPAADAPRQRLWVQPPTSFGIPAEMVQAFGDAVSNEAGQVGNYNVLTEKDLETLLTVDQRKQATGCSEPSCFTDIGALMNVQMVLACSAKTQDDMLLLTCDLLDVKAGEKKTKDRKVAQKVVAMTDAARALVDILLTGAVKDRRGVVELKSTEEGSKVFVDGKEVGSTPMKEPLHLDEGKRTLEVKKSGFATWRTVLDVQAGTFTTVNATLTASRIFQVWPFGLAAIGTAVLGSAVALSLGLALGSTADCYYGGFIGSGYTESARAGSGGIKAAGDGVANGMGWSKSVVCSRLPLSTPAYKERPIDSIDYKAREQQFIFVGDWLANAAYAVGVGVLVIGVGAGVALLATDAIIRFTRKEE
jgi:hypothetical protein